MEKLKMVEAILIDAIADELSKGVDRANTEELYKVTDILKDVEMIIEYHLNNKGRMM